MVCKPLEKPKQKHKKGLWSPDEDLRLKNYILKYGHGCWSSIPNNAGLKRNGKSCRLRWINYLRPGLKRGRFNAHEEEMILNLHGLLGNKWSHIAHHLPGRTDNEIKNFWHTCLKKKIVKQEQTESQNIIPITSEIMGNNTDSSISSPNPIWEPFENTEGSSTQNSNLPKVLFAEWLSLDQFQGQNFVADSNQMKGNCERYLSSEDHHFNCFESVLGNKFRNDIISNEVGDEMFINPQFKLKAWFHDSSFANFMSGDVTPNDMHLNNDAMYNF